MATENSNSNIDLSETFSQAENFFDKNKKAIGTVLGGVALVVAGYFAYTMFVVAPNEKLAQEQMFMAEKYFEKDSLNKAINGDGNNVGFKQIIEEYGSTKSGNLAHYYLGISYLKTGKFQDAIDQLESFNSNEQVVKPIATGAIGDAYSELGETEKAVTNYLKAAKEAENKFISPVFLMKAGLGYEQLNKFADAAEVYSQVKKDYSESNEARDAEKYLARANAMIK